MTCTKCKINKQKAGTGSWCQACSNDYERIYWAKLTPVQKQSRWLKKRYGLTYDDFLVMYEKQDRKCSLCLTDIYTDLNNKGRSRAVVDHCHDTGKV